ncbi:hypothetical protein D8674_009908 [Pyrus ussuriensis x Pyrus communis]|uniref:Uncharacterized protein n=1 Tax=Pyrus ussuriensis x Pyrus communis TaxID=2448454 RepID=A0A5N5F9L4_9ROSA|nr:hypothetical protein D8674_009908 [Pyrus ussuriensis x Pyrus communis]
MREANALEMAFQNQWVGRDSTHKAQQLSVDMLSWFSSKVPPYVEDIDVENFLHEQQLMIVNDEYLHRNH